MQKIRAVIVDDQQENVELLQYLIAKYCALIEVVGFAYTKDDAITIINENEPQLVFLDIELGDDSGFDVAASFEYHKFRIIFVTSFDDYAVKAFKYNAMDYLLKPVKIEELVEAVNKCYEDLLRDNYTPKEQISKLDKSLQSQDSLDFIAVSSVDKIEFLQLEDIVYLKSDGRYTNFHKQDGSRVTSSRNLGEYEKILDLNQFFRVHNSYIVNISHIKEIYKSDGGYCLMSTQDSVPIAKRRHELFIKFLKLK